jgi:outer membrane protein assembly factor BamA
LLSIHVKGLQHFTENQVIAASGLKLGQQAGEAEFQQAAQKLGETGVFSELTYSYKYSTSGCDLQLQVTENEKLLPIIFDNFVWFSDEQLQNLLKAALPLFNGRVPAGGNLTDQVAQALTAILSDHKIEGQVEYLPFAAENGPVTGYEYRVNFHSIVVRNVDFPGASAEELPLLQAAARSFAGEDYLRSRLLAQERLDLLPVYEARGYLKAHFSDAQPKVAQDGPQTLVDVSLPVAPGLQYKLTALEITGNTAFPTDKLRDLIQLKTGEPANSVELASDLQQMHKLYGTKGYLFARVNAVPSMDDSNATVSYKLNVVEDDMYRMGDLSIEGLPEENANRMTAQWQMKKGDPFDDSYPQRFFSILYRDFGLRGSYNVAQKRAINRQDKTVSVVLHFEPTS